MKKVILFFIMVILAGCTYEGEKLKTYFEDPRTFIRDPHYSNYKQKRDNLESKYLNKEIAYSEYMEQMQNLDDTYSMEVQKRRDIIEGN